MENHACLFLGKVAFELDYVLCLSVLGSDVVYSEGAVVDLLDTLVQLCGAQTTIFLAGELRNGES